MVIHWLKHILGYDEGKKGICMDRDSAFKHSAVSQVTEEAPLEIGPPCWLWSLQVPQYVLLKPGNVSALFLLFFCIESSAQFSDESGQWCKIPQVSHTSVYSGFRMLSCKNYFSWEGSHLCCCMKIPTRKLEPNFIVLQEHKQIVPEIA